MWANLLTYTLVLEPDTRAALSLSATVLAVSSALLLAMGLLRRRGVKRGLLGSCAVAVMVSSLVAPLVLRGPARVEAPPSLPRNARTDLAAADRQTRVRVIALDAGSLEIITNAAAAGRLPNFGRIFKPSGGPMKPITMAGIAKAAGVSQGAISSLLNDRDYGIRVSEKTRERVFKVCRELGYVPNDLRAVVRMYPELGDTCLLISEKIPAGVSI